jgi:DNA-binding response OmpR family regulator
MPYKILIIEDDDNVAKMLTARLADVGYESKISSDATLGVQQALNWLPQLIVLDLLLPAGGGLSVLKRLRDSDKTRAIPIVILTAVDNQAYRQETSNLGAAAYFTKPYDANKLLEQIRVLIEKPT